MNKAAIRKDYLAARQSIPRGELVARSTDIAKRVQDLVNWHAVCKVHMYRAQRNLNEVETSWFEAYLATVWPQIKLSIVNADKAAPLPIDDYDLIIIPLLAFDDRGHRLGYGGGWYDRFLAAQPQAITLGLAFDMQRYAPALPVESHDIPLHYVVTETRIIG